MKKTIITLAALAVASVASAADYTFDVPAPENLYAGDYTFQFSIQDASDVSSEGTLLASYHQGYGWGLDINKFVLTNTDGAITLTVGRGNQDGGWDSSNVRTFTSTLSTGTIYTISSVGVSGTQTVTLSGIDTVPSDTVAYNGNMNGDNGAKTMPTEINQPFAPVTPSTPSVPEPTTATLSLLALAGLAARRRRK